MNGVIELVGAVIAGGVIQSVFRYFLDKNKTDRRENRTDFELMLSALYKENEILRERLRHSEEERYKLLDAKENDE